MAAGMHLMAPAPAFAVDSVTVAGQTRALDGTNVYRATNYLVMYTPARGATTGTNQYGFEAAVVDGKVTKIEDTTGNMAIPSNGVVLSGHGTSRTWLKTYATVGATVTLPGETAPPPPPPPPPPPEGDYVTVGSSTRDLDGTNVTRTASTLILYTPARGATTGTNQFGFEAAVVDGKITKVENGIGDMAIPSNGVVLSGHGTERTWLANNAAVGVTVTFGAEPPPPPPPPPGGTQLLPDLGVRTLGGFFINTTAMPGVKQLKFPTVTANVGTGAFEVNATRDSSSDPTWDITQKIYKSDGTSSSHPVTGTDLYYGGDGHNHWHVRDLDRFELLNGNGQRLRLGEKHGFCFEDNTSYRDWPGRVEGSPSSPFYKPPAICAVGATQTTTVQQGLSVGWGDTYPSTLPDQYIDITGLSNGRYRVQVTADWDNWFTEANETNNTSWAEIQIKDNTVSVVSTGGGM